MAIKAAEEIYTKTPYTAYMGQLVEWPEVVTEGRTLEECRTSLRDALHERIRGEEAVNRLQKTRGIC